MCEKLTFENRRLWELVEAGMKGGEKQTLKTIDLPVAEEEVAEDGAVAVVFSTQSSNAVALDTEPMHGLCDSR